MADDEARIDWSTATVSDGTLTVELEGERPKGWKGAFETTLKLLGHGQWGEVTLKKGTVTVPEVEPGNEDKLRHHLEAVVEQANASLRPEEEPDGGGGDDDDDADGQTEDDGPDTEMASTFRSFAEDAGSGSGSGGASGSDDVDRGE